MWSLLLHGPRRTYESEIYFEIFPRGRNYIGEGFAQLVTDNVKELTTRVNECVGMKIDIDGFAVTAVKSGPTHGNSKYRDSHAEHDNPESEAIWWKPHQKANFHNAECDITTGGQTSCKIEFPHPPYDDLSVEVLAKADLVLSTRSFSRSSLFVDVEADQFPLEPISYSTALQVPKYMEFVSSAPASTLTLAGNSLIIENDQTTKRQSYFITVDDLNRLEKKDWLLFVGAALFGTAVAMLAEFVRASAKREKRVGRSTLAPKRADCRSAERQEEGWSINVINDCDFTTRP